MTDIDDSGASAGDVNREIDMSKWRENRMMTTKGHTRIGDPRPCALKA